MSTEADLKNMFADSAPTLAQIDLQRVLRRSSRRRVGHQVAIGSATTLAVAGIGVAGFTGIRGVAPIFSAGSAGSASSTAADTTRQTLPPGSSAVDGGVQQAPASRLNLCGGTLAEVAPTVTGLVLSTKFDPADASATLITGEVTLTNTSSAPISGSSAVSPSITLSKDGSVLWHSNGAMAAIARMISLEPGASTTYEASFAPVTCGIIDDESTGFRADLPHVAPGIYQVSAALDVTRESRDNEPTFPDLVTGESSSVTLR